MEGKDWNEFEKQKCELENRYNKFFIKSQKIISERK